MGLPYYREYRWKQGKPVGQGAFDPGEEDFCYRVVSDPYHKRLSVELYQGRRFQRTLYDSALLDFRHITPQAQVGWSREDQDLSASDSQALIRNLEDRVILIERYCLEGDRCHECEILAPVGLRVATQRLYYEDEGARASGVVLLDLQENPVMYKRYRIGEDGQFSELVEENWEIDGEMLPF